MNQSPFVLTGLASRGGLSNWVFFFFPTEAVMIDVGTTPAIKASVQAGVLSQFGAAGHAALGRQAYGPQNVEGKGLDDWRAELQAKAKNVRVLKDDEIRTVRLHLKAMWHELYVVSADGISQKFGFANRKQAEAIKDSLSQRFGSRFEISTSAPFAFFRRYAPFLMS